MKGDFHVIAFFILLAVGYLVTTVLNFVYKWAQQLFLRHEKIISHWFIFSEYFLTGGLASLWSRGFNIFQSRILSSAKAMNICEDTKSKQSVPVLKWSVVQIDIKL